MLAQLNLAADSASDGKEALNMWVKQPYQVVLTDLQMPEMDGIELTRAIREREHNMGGSPSYIVGVTANVLPEHKEKCLSAGMDDFLTKPLKMEALKRALQKYNPAAKA
jgi:CheY-like chemotaxis protein